MTSRLALPGAGPLSDAQRAVRDSILATRGNLDGPFLAWMLSPGLAAPAEQLGAFCRYRTSLDTIETELLILMVAAEHRCVGEQQIHEPIALKAGLPEAAVAAIRNGQRPALPGERLPLLADLAIELLQRHRIADPLYRRAVAVFGESTIVEAVGVIGYYALVAHTLNAFEMRTG